MKAINVEAAKELIKKYRSFSVKNIKDMENISTGGYGYSYGHNMAIFLTGFGSYLNCTLCKAVSYDCRFCIYDGIKSYGHCFNNQHKFSYYEIDKAETPYQLWLAFRRRANHIEKYLKTL